MPPSPGLGRLAEWWRSGLWLALVATLLGAFVSDRADAPESVAQLAQDTADTSATTATKKVRRGPSWR